MIVGYGIAGPGEAGRYMRRTLDEFKRLCDTTIILGNNITQAERDLIAEYGFKLVEDNREWGIHQWRIKEDFINNHVAQSGIREKDMLVCLDMDEIFSDNLTKQWIEKAPLDAYHCFIINFWNDEQHYKKEASFWNVRIWRWNGVTKWKEKPVHCGLAPEWAYHYHRFAPVLLKHYGLMNRDDRQKKIARYEKYDPTAKHMDRRFYKMLGEDTAEEYNESIVLAAIEKEVATYQQTKPKKLVVNEQKRYAYVMTPFGKIVDIPEKDLSETLRRKGFSFVEWHRADILETVIPVTEEPLICKICGYSGENIEELAIHKKKKHST